MNDKSRSLLLMCVLGVVTSARAAIDTTTNQIGRMTSTGTSESRVFYEYDASGRNAAMQYVQDGQSRIFRTRYGYPQNPDTTSGPGTVIRSQIFPDGEEVSYTYDANGTQVTVRATLGTVSDDILRDLRLNARGQTTRVEYGNGVVTTLQYDEQGTLRLSSSTSVTNAGVKVQEYTYRQDENGNVTAVLDGLRSGQSATFTYDELDQLTAILDPLGGAVERYEYDSAGNLKTKGALTQTYGGPGFPAHGIAASSGLPYSYDPNGNVTAIGASTTIAWNADNMPLRVTAGSVVTDKSYIGGTLWKKVEQGITTYYAPGLRIENGVMRKYYGSYAERLEQPGARELRFYQSDHLGSSSVMTDQGGTVIRRASYLPWGGDRAVEGTFTPKLQFNFKEKDANGLYDYGARLYNPNTGRWLSPDPTVTDGLNRYAYVRNNPMTRIDPTGYKSGWYKHETKTKIDYVFLSEDPGPGYQYIGVNVKVKVHNVYWDDGKGGRGKEKYQTYGAGEEWLYADGTTSRSRVATVVTEAPPSTATFAGVNVGQYRRRLDTVESKTIQNVVGAAGTINLQAGLGALGPGTALPSFSASQIGRNAGVIAINEASPAVSGGLDTAIGFRAGVQEFMSAHPEREFNYLNDADWSPLMQSRWQGEVIRSGSRIVQLPGGGWTEVEAADFFYNGCIFTPPY